jgi:hypothetical protein
VPKVVWQAIEFYADLYVPISTTPAHILADSGVPIAKYCPHTGWYDPRVGLMSYYPKLEITWKRARKKIEMHKHILRNQGFLKEEK